MGLYGTPLAGNAHLDAVADGAFVVLAQFAAILVIAAAFILFVHPVLIEGVMLMMIVLRVSAKRAKQQRGDEEWSHAALQLLELPQTGVALKAAQMHSSLGTGTHNPKSSSIALLLKLATP
jgi:hypothetical protein